MVSARPLQAVLCIVWSVRWVAAFSPSFGPAARPTTRLAAGAAASTFERALATGAADDALEALEAAPPDLALSPAAAAALLDLCAAPEPPPPEASIVDPVTGKTIVFSKAELLLWGTPPDAAVQRREEARLLRAYEALAARGATPSFASERVPSTLPVQGGGELSAVEFVRRTGLPQAALRPSGAADGRWWAAAVALLALEVVEMTCHTSALSLFNDGGVTATWLLALEVVEMTCRIRVVSLQNYGVTATIWLLVLETAGSAALGVPLGALLGATAALAALDSLALGGAGIEAGTR